MERCIWVDCVQGSDEWKAARVGKITASRFADVLTNGRAGQPSQTALSYMLELIVEQLTGLPADEIKAKSLDWGHKYEKDARATYTMLTGNGVDQVGFATMLDWPQVGASVDGLVGEDGTAEIKCPWNSTVHLTTLLTMRVPKEYQYQVQGQLMVTNRSWCDFVSYDPRMPQTYRCVIIREYRDDKFIEKIKERIELFIEGMKDLMDRLDASALKLIQS